MNYGLYLSASGMFANMYRQDVVANNLANVNTNGFKPDSVMFHWRDAERIEDQVSQVPSKEMLEKLGGGVWIRPNITRFEKGEMTETLQPLDVAIEGEGFFTLTTGKGNDNQRLRFTRDGQFTINPEGFLVHVASGMKTLDWLDRTIRLDGTGAVKIRPDGTVEQGGRRVARIELTTVSDLGKFKKTGANLFELDNAQQTNRQPATGTMKQGWLEGSAVNPMEQLMQLNKATGAISANARMLKFHEEITNLAINRFGRVT